MFIPRTLGTSTLSGYTINIRRSLTHDLNEKKNLHRLEMTTVMSSLWT